MSSNTPAKPIRTGLSLYANLLDPAAPGTISRAPVTFGKPDEEHKDSAAAQKQRISAGSYESIR
jgi:hypothetical protein